MGLSPDHARTFPLVLNLDISTITPQFHVVFDDWFTTVASSVDDLPDFNSSAWSKMFGYSVYQFIRDEDDTQVDPEDSRPQKTLPPAKPSINGHGHHHASQTLASISSSIFTFHSFQTSLPCTIFPMSPSSPPIAVPYPLIDASPPAQHQSENTHLPQPQQQREPSRTGDTHSPQLL